MRRIKIFFSNNKWLLLALLGLGLLVYFTRSHSRKLISADLLEAQREELEEVRFRESEIHEEELCRLADSLKKHYENIESKTKFIPYEKVVYRYYNADSILRILNGAKY